MAEAKALYTIRERTGIISVGALLIFLYALCVALVVIGFSAYVIRSDWNGALSNNGGEVKELDNLRFLVQRDTELGNLIAEAQVDIQTADTAIRTTSQTVESLRLDQGQLDAAYQETAASAHSSLSAMALQLEPADQLRIENLLVLGEAQAVVDVVNRVMLQIPSVTFREDVNPQSKKRIQEAISVLSERMKEMKVSLSQLRTEIQNAESNNQRAHEERSFHLKRQNSHQVALDDLRLKLPIYSEHRTRWISMSDSSWWNPLPKLVSAPTILLTLMVTIAAGALGTLVAYSRTTFLNQAVPSGSRLMIILGEGIAAAIGIFLFAGAGMLVLSQGGGPEGRLELSPYTVAFLAFLSGFMAESAFAKISGFGDDLFRNRENGDLNATQNGDATTSENGQQTEADETDSAADDAKKPKPGGAS